MATEDQTIKEIAFSMLDTAVDLLQLRKSAAAQQASQKELSDSDFDLLAFPNDDSPKTAPKFAHHIQELDFVKNYMTAHPEVTVTQCKDALKMLEEKGLIQRTHHPVSQDSEPNTLRVTQRGRAVAVSSSAQIIQEPEAKPSDVGYSVRAAGSGYTSPEQEGWRIGS